MTEPKAGGEIKNVDWTFYNTFDEIQRWLLDRVAAHPNVLSSVVIGTSSQGRPLTVVRYSERAVSVLRRFLYFVQQNGIYDPLVIFSYDYGN